jgi:hypothetical protein
VGASRLKLHRVDFINLESSAIFEDRQDNGQPYSRFSRSDHHDKKRVDVTVDLLPLIGESNKAQVNGIEHQLDRHENRDDAFAVDKARDAERKKDGA